MNTTPRSSKNSTMSLFLGLLLVSITFPASAELQWSGTYAGVTFSDSEDKFESDSGEIVKVTRGHLKAKYGWIINDYLSLEAHLGGTTNLSSSKGIVTYGGYARIGKDFDQYKLYGMLGFSGIEDLDEDSDVSETGGSYGVGIEIFGSKDIALTLEYIQMLDKSVDGGDLTFDTFGLGFTYYFTEDTSYFNKNRNKIKSIRY